jgi:hypothetical protein
MLGRLVSESQSYSSGVTPTQEELDDEQPASWIAVALEYNAQAMGIRD